MTRQRFADQRQRTYVEAIVNPAIGGGDAIAQPSGISESAHERAAFAVDVA
jgi:hypothetical protein